MKDERPMKVLLIESSPVVGARLSSLIGGLAGVEVVAWESTGTRGLKRFREHRPEAVVLDIELPDGSGLNVLKRIKEESPGCLVTVLVSYAFPELRVRCSDLKADFFFEKSSDFERVAEVLKEASSRQT